jgi:hypothetical protein
MVRAPEGRLFNPHGCEALRAEQACVLLIRTIVEGAKRPRQRSGSAAGRAADRPLQPVVSRIIVLWL